MTGYMAVVEAYGKRSRLAEFTYLVYKSVEAYVLGGERGTLESLSNWTVAVTVMSVGFIGHDTLMLTLSYRRPSSRVTGFLL